VLLGLTPHVSAALYFCVRVTFLNAARIDPAGRHDVVLVVSAHGRRW